MELFPQHCQLPNLTPHQHLQALTNKLTQATTLANQTTKGRQLIRYLGHQIEPLLHPTLILKEQRVVDEEQRVVEALQRQAQEEEQRVINNTQKITFPCIADIPTIMQTCILNRQMCLKEHKMPPPLHYQEQNTGHHAGPIHITRAGHRCPKHTATFHTNKHADRDVANWSAPSNECTCPARTSFLLHVTHSTRP
jgi:hypothetical protein